ncbi:MAG: nucleotide pyrophosphatase, partial [Thermoprotei archaeon]
MTRRLLIIGLDCASPKLLYEEFREELPTLEMLTSDGLKAELISSHPPITIPAWSVMVTGKTPGELGLYGFRHRKPGMYNDFYIANSRSVREPAVWDFLGRRGLKTIVVGVPPSYPPKPVRGIMIGCFITPGPESRYTFPPTLKREIESRFGRYIFDVVYRSEDRDRVIREVWAMTK